MPGGKVYMRFKINEIGKDVDKYFAKHKEYRTVRVGVCTFLTDYTTILVPVSS
jgi:hypothetical protein